MTVLITGGRGLLGSALTDHLRRQGHRVLIASRSAEGPDVVPWDPQVGRMDLGGVDRLEAVIHLAGENLAEGRWTAAKKRRILESRRLGTRTLVTALKKLPEKPRTLISASGVNFYATDTGQVMTEKDVAGEDFLSEVCQVWERETLPATDAGIRVMRARLGVVITPRGGALEQMVPLFKWGLGARLGDGRQRLSWVGLPDVVGVFSAALQDARYEGPINVVSPNVVTNAEFTRAVARSLQRPAFLCVPAPALKLLLGEMAEATLLADLAVEPARLRQLGYAFRTPELETALDSEGEPPAASASADGEKA